MTRRTKSKSQLVNSNDSEDQSMELTPPSNEPLVAKTNIEFLFRVIYLSIPPSHNTESIWQTSFVTKWKLVRNCSENGETIKETNQNCKLPKYAQLCCHVMVNEHSVQVT